MRADPVVAMEEEEPESTTAAGSSPRSASLAQETPEQQQQEEEEDDEGARDGKCSRHTPGARRHNWRSDAVQRLLSAAQAEGTLPSARLSLESILTGKSGATPSPRRGFQRLRASTAEETIGPNSFEFLDLVGRGAFAEVYHVRHKSTGWSYAMKIQQKEKILRSNLLKYAMTERYLLSFIQHPYIVPLHYAFQTHSQLVLVLKYCPGGNLQQLLKHLGRHLRALDEPCSRHFAAELLLALVYLHERSIVYRDLKPDNVLIDEEGHAALTDFGLSKSEVKRGTGTKTHCGSVAYIAPEILLGTPHDHTVDIYNLGVLVYTMLFGLPPFFHREKDMLRHNIANATLEIPPFFPFDATAFIRATMCREPRERLGARDTSELQKHDFFAKVDFVALAKRQVPAPSLPDLPKIGPQGLEPPAQPPLRRRRGRLSSPASNVRIAGWDFKAPLEGPAFAGSNEGSVSPARRKKRRRFRGLLCLRWLTDARV